MLHVFSGVSEAIDASAENEAIKFAEDLWTPGPSIF